MRLIVLIACLTAAAGVVSAANPTAPTPSPAPAAPMEAPPELQKTPGDFLKPEPFPSDTLPGFYNEIPAHLEPAVRMAAEDNYASSSEVLYRELGKASDPKEKARILMWLGVTQGQQAMDYDSASGWYGIATTATKHLREAMKLDPEVFKAADVARVLGQMIGSGWASETPESEIDMAEKKAKEKKSGIDYFYAGVILQRVAQRSWEFSETREEDERTLGMFARAIVTDPDLYDVWPMYAGSLIRLEMYDLLTTDVEKMYARFRPLRMPLLGDQGPSELYLRSRGQIPREMAEHFLSSVKQSAPQDPYPHFTLASVQMGAEMEQRTTPTKSIEMYEDFLASIKDGRIKLKPREQGYRISALYKLGYLYRLIGESKKSLDTYLQIKALSPKYAETDYNLAETYLTLANEETTGPKKLELLDLGRAAARAQSENDYKNRASLKADELRRRISAEQRRVKSVLDGTAKPGSGNSSPAPSNFGMPPSFGM